MKEIEKQIQAVRPRLRDAAPLIHKIVWAFALFNFWIALSLYLQSSVNLKLVPIMNGFTGKDFWTSVFLLLGVGLVVGLASNSMRWIRRLMVAGVCVKAIWFYALIAVGWKYGFVAQLGVIGLWFFAAWIQVLAVIYFIPKDTKSTGVLRDRLTDEQ